MTLDGSRQDRNREGTQWVVWWTLAAFISVLLIEGILAYKLFASEGNVLIAIASIMAVLTGLAVLSVRTFDLGEFSIGRGGVRATLNRVQQRQEEQERLINAVQRAQDELRQISREQSTLISQLQLVVQGLVNDFEYEKLLGLVKDSPFMVRFHWDMYHELKNLDAIRYVEPQPGHGINSILGHDGIGDEFDLKQYVRITNKGVEYLLIRAALEGRSSLVDIGVTSE